MGPGKEVKVTIMHQSQSGLGRSLVDTDPALLFDHWPNCNG